MAAQFDPDARTAPGGGPAAVTPLPPPFGPGARAAEEPPGPPEGFRVAQDANGRTLFSQGSAERLAEDLRRQGQAAEARAVPGSGALFRVFVRPPTEVPAEEEPPSSLRIFTPEGEAFPRTAAPSPATPSQIGDRATPPPLEVPAPPDLPAAAAVAREAVDALAPGSAPIAGTQTPTRQRTGEQRMTPEEVEALLLSRMERPAPWVTRLAPTTATRALLLAYAWTVVGICLYVPWKGLVWVSERTGRFLVRDLIRKGRRLPTPEAVGYDWVWAPPVPLASVDVTRLLLELLAVTILAAAAYVWLVHGSRSTSH